MTTSATMIESPVAQKVAPPPTKCLGCGGERWKYNVTYSTTIDLPSGAASQRAQSNEEIRCAACNRKAVTDISQGVRASTVWKQVRRREDGKL